MSASIERLARKSRVSNSARESLATWKGRVFLCASVLLITGASWDAGRAPLLAISAVLFSLFVILVARHNRMADLAEQFKIRCELEQRLRAINELNWQHIPDIPNTPCDRPFPHTFDDLDIIQGRSLVRLLDLSFSTLGFRRLLERFDGNGVSREEILRRQESVAELRDMRVLRRKLLTKSRLSKARIDAEGLSSIVRQPFVIGGWKKPFCLLVVFQAAAFTAFVWFFFHGGRPYFFAPSIVALFLIRAAGKKIFAHKAFGNALSLSSSLDTFQTVSAILTRLAHTPKPRLRQILRPFSRERAPRRRIMRLNRVITALGLRQNPVAHILFNVAFPWDFYWTLRLETLRLDLGQDLVAWLDALAEIEVTASLAEFSCMNPNYTRPELLLDSSDIFVSAEDLGHPLIASDIRVGNALELTTKAKCDLITGSNMSGKSTFLRSTGISLLLAKAGSVVPARVFAFRNVDLVTSLRPVDSLADGISSFYAEVRQLKSILEHAESGVPTVYLIDEVFRGTNNRERLAGSAAYINALLQTGAAGLVTTHDLELAMLEGTSKKLRTWHFRDEIENNRMTFGFRKHPGPCPTTNALRVMALAGLPIDLPGMDAKTESMPV